MRTSIHVATIASAAALLLTTRPVLAEDGEMPRPRQGYYVSAGAVGSLSLSRERQALGRTLAGGGGMLRLGELITPALGLGLSLDGGIGTGADRNTTAYLGFDAHYLVLDLIALHGGVGFGFSRLQDPNEPKAGSRGGIGATYVLGVSYDWFLTDRGQSGGFSVTPAVQIRLTDAGKVKTGQLFIGVQVTWWSGLDKARLALDEARAYERE